MNRLLILVVSALSMMLAASPAFAQEDPANKEGMVEGTFRVIIDGEVPENYSVYVETDAAIGGQGPICTTDAVMVDEGYAECVGAGGANELRFYAPEGTPVNYRILGSQGNELSQEVIKEGSTIAKTGGLMIEARLTFDGEGENSEDDDESNDDSNNNDDSAASEQYEDDSSADGKSSGKGDDKASDGVLPDTGGSSLVLVAGASLLLAAGGFLGYRAIS